MLEDLFAVWHQTQHISRLSGSNNGDQLHYIQHKLRGARGYRAASSSDFILVFHIVTKMH